MSDSILRIIPADPALVPDVGAQQSAGTHARKAFPKADEVTVRVEEDVTFVDAGGNFEAVFCPACEAELEQERWADARDRAAASSFVNLAVSAPCCGAPTSLNDLRYEMPQGFARLIIEVMNPNTAEVPRGVERLLRDTLGCEIRFVWAHY